MTIAFISLLISLFISFIAGLLFENVWTYFLFIWVITINLYLWRMRKRYERVAQIVIDKNPEIFTTEEQKILLKAPGIFFPQHEFFSFSSKIEFAAASGWIQVLTAIFVIVMLIKGFYFVGLLGGLVALPYFVMNKLSMSFFSEDEAKNVARMYFLVSGKYLRKEKEPEILYQTRVYLLINKKLSIISK